MAKKRFIKMSIFNDNLPFFLQTKLNTNQFLFGANHPNNFVNKPHHVLDKLDQSTE